MATLHERIVRARDAFAAAGIDLSEASLDAELLARHVLGWDRAHLLAALRDPEPDAFGDRYALLVARRARREPVSLITGVREFWGLDFEVTPDVLTPRPETELIVEETIARLPREGTALIADVGTGSGCLAVALATELPRARVVATDVSGPALNVARRNASRHGVGGRVDVRRTNVLEGVDDTFDAIVSNPPYVPEADADALPDEVRGHEPHVALFGGTDGLDVYRRLFPQAASRLAANGHLIVEIGIDQEDRVVTLARRHGWTLDHFRRDLQGIVRTLVFARGHSNGTLKR
jgi:release factor glutamine methyltransferase